MISKLSKVFSIAILICIEVLIGCSCTGQSNFPSSENLTSKQIRQDINAHRPLCGYKIPRNLADHLGSTHMGGKYYLTEKPFLIEGARKVSDLGMKVFKIFLGQKGTELKGFPYHSEWNLPLNASYTQMISHPYVKEAFSFDFSTIILNVTDADQRLSMENPDFNDVYNNIYELSVYLLKEYKNRDITFIIKNWEGDWVLRGPNKKTQDWVNSKDKERRITNMIAWIRTRQKAVTDARESIKQTKAKVMLAVEANKVMDAMNGVLGVANKVLPEVKVDMVSWSSYDGMSSSEDFYRGVKYLQQQIDPTDYMKGEHKVMIGEIGIPENLQLDNIETRLDEFMGVCFALDVEYLVYWELYCNEPIDKSHRDKFYPPCKPEELKGLWLYRPDGTKSESCKYFDRILQNAGGSIKSK